MSTPINTDTILIAILTGIMTLFSTDAKRMIMAKISTMPRETRVANNTALRTSKTSFLMSFAFSIPKNMICGAAIFRTSVVFEDKFAKIVLKIYIIRHYFLT